MRGMSLAERVGVKAGSLWFSFAGFAWLLIDIYCVLIVLWSYCFSLTPFSIDIQCCIVTVCLLVTKWHHY